LLKLRGTETYLKSLKTFKDPKIKALMKIWLVKLQW